MRTYETLYIIHPDVTEDDVQAMSNKVESLVTEAGGEIVKSEIWGKRRLAYEVRTCREGYYVLLRFSAPETFIETLDSHFRLADQVIRYLLIHMDENALRLEASQKKRKEAEIRNSVAAARSRAGQSGGAPASAPAAAPAETPAAAPAPSAEIAPESEQPAPEAEQPVAEAAEQD
ncbi:MAG: 30S ribosomal protein S6 [Nitrospiraceae bacterium]|nr:30S ribosomal protein S6 [Nitrospiraceae bacterium]